jgi:DNA polymerase III subunit gamma/tau
MAGKSGVELLSVAGGSRPSGWRGRPSVLVSVRLCPNWTVTSLNQRICPSALQRLGQCAVHLAAPPPAPPPRRPHPRVSARLGATPSPEVASSRNLDYCPVAPHVRSNRSGTDVFSERSGGQATGAAPGCRGARSAVSGPRRDRRLDCIQWHADPIGACRVVWSAIAVELAPGVSRPLPASCRRAPPVGETHASPTGARGPDGAACPSAVPTRSHRQGPWSGLGAVGLAAMRPPADGLSSAAVRGGNLLRFGG